MLTAVKSQEAKRLKKKKKLVFLCNIEEKEIENSIRSKFNYWSIGNQF